MGIIQIVIIGLGLSMDAFAVSICRGLSMREVKHNDALLTALFFGVFQALMPILGWLLGKSVLSLIERYDHWVAFGLLLIVGGKMLWEAFSEEGESCESSFSLGALLLSAVATSIDALAVGLTLAVLHTGVWSAAALIGVITFVISLSGVYIGALLGGSRLQKIATVTGGLVLISIGAQILLEHLGLL